MGLKKKKSFRPAIEVDSKIGCFFIARLLYIGVITNSYGTLSVLTLKNDLTKHEHVHYISTLVFSVTKRI